MKKISENNINRILNIWKKIVETPILYMDLRFSHFYNNNKVLIYFKEILN